MELTPSSHIDTFTKDALPPAGLWPKLEFTLPELEYPARLNAASELIDRTVDEFGPDRDAIRTLSGDHLTYGELQQRANQIANLLTEEFGIVPGNRVLLRMYNNPWAVACWLGALKAGAVIVTSMVAWREHELRKVLTKTKPSVVIVDHRSLADVSDYLEESVTMQNCIIFGGDDDQLVTQTDSMSTEFEAVLTAADDVALLNSTSGTTGEPKITMHFHRDILAIADTFAKHTLDLGPDDVSACTAPLAFTFGLGALVVFPLRTGGCAVLQEKATPVQLTEEIENLGITVLYTAPTGYRAILKAGLADKLRALRIGVAAGEHLPKQTFEAVREATGLSLVNGIGSTELLHVFVSASGDDIRPGATGKAVPGYRAMVLNDDGTEAEDGAPGRLAVIGPTGCRYMSDARQRQYVVDGWNITGDTFVRDKDGYFHFQARTDSMIITAGYNVSAAEVEEIIELHPDVLECAVIGIPDPFKGTVVTAVVVARETSDGPLDDSDKAALEKSIIDHVASNVAVYKCPRRISFVDSLPRNPSGKVQHFVLRESAIADSL